MRALIRSGLLVAVCAFASACGGGGGGGGGATGETPPAPVATTTVSGIVSDDPVSGANVEIRSLSGSVLGSARSDASGAYGLSIPSSSLQGGFLVVASGGTSRGRPFSGELRAAYAGVESPTSANATLLTTLVMLLADRESTSGDLLAKRNAVLDRLATNTVLARDQWNSISPTNVVLDSLRADVLTRGLIPALTEMADGLSAVELASPREAVFRVFPTTLGGVLGVAYGAAVLPNPLNVFAGDALQALPANLSTTSAAGSTRQFALLNPPVGMTIDSSSGSLSYRLPSGSTATVPFTVRVTTAAGRRDVTGTIVPIVVSEVAGGTATGGQQVITDVVGRFALVLASGAAANGTRLTLQRGEDPNGRVFLRVVSEPALLDASKVELQLPDPGVSIAATPRADLITAKAGVEGRAKPGDATDADLCQPGTDAPYLWYYHRGRFASYGSLVPTVFTLGAYARLPEERQRIPLGSVRVARTTTLLYVVEDFDAVLCGPVPKSQAASLRAEPVVFVHGYQRGETLGAAPRANGNSTFGDFLKLVNETTISNAAGSRTLGSFLFRWNTNQRFGDAALRLREALADLSHETQTSRVHLVAHSFGGVLVRTYLQGIGSSSSYERPVASVTSFGSPYSGLFPESANSSFPAGYDGNSGVLGRALANQVTAHQMGDSIGNDALLADLFLARLGETAESLADVASNPIRPATLKYRSMIGLRRTGLTARFGSGDGLISFAGQRFLPSYRSTTALADNLIVGGVSVTERLLGVSDNDSLQFISRGGAGQALPNEFGFSGYAHTNLQAEGGLYGLVSGVPGEFAICTEVFLRRGTGCSEASLGAVIQSISGAAGNAAPPAPTTIATIRIRVVGPSSSSVSIRARREGTPNALAGSPTVAGDVFSVPVRFSAGQVVTLTVEAAGYVPAVARIALPTSAPASPIEAPSLELTPLSVTTTASYSATVRNASTGATIGGASWTLSCNQFTISSGTTDSTGRIAVGSIPRVQCSVVVSAPGVAGTGRTVSFATSASVTEDIRLDPLVVAPTVLIDTIGAGSLACRGSFELYGNPIYDACGGGYTVGSSYRTLQQRAAIALDMPTSGPTAISRVSLLLFGSLGEAEVSVREDAGGRPNLSSALATRRIPFVLVPPSSPPIPLTSIPPASVDFGGLQLVAGRRYWLDLSAGPFGGPLFGSGLWAMGLTPRSGPVARGRSDGAFIDPVPATFTPNYEVFASRAWPAVRVELTAGAVAQPPVSGPLGPVTYDVTAQLQFVTPSLQAWNALGFNLATDATLRAVLSYDPTTAANCSEVTGFVGCNWSSALKVLEIYVDSPVNRFSATLTMSARTEFSAGGSLTAFVGTGRITGQNALFIGSVQLRKFNDPQFNARVLPTAFGPLGEYSLKTLNLQSSDQNLIGYTLSADVVSVTRRQ